MPASRLVRAALVLTAASLLLVTAAGTASGHVLAHTFQLTKPSVVDRAPYTASPAFQTFGARRMAAPGAQQHGGDTNHLPPVNKNMQLISKFEPTSQGPIQPEQIADLDVYKGYAYLNSWAQPGCDKGGFYVVDIRNPSAPQEVKFVPALAGNFHGEGAHVITLDTPGVFSGDVLAVNNEMCGATPDGGGGFDLYDVSDPTNPVPLVQGFGDFGGEGALGEKTSPTQVANSSHSIFIWDAGPNAYAVIVDNEEFHDVDIFDITDPRNPRGVREYDLFETAPEAITDSANGGNGFHHDMVVKQINGTWVLSSSYWDAGYINLNANNPADLVYMNDTDFGGTDPLTGFNPPEGNAHQSEFSFDNKYIVTGEEDFAPFRIVEIDIANVGKRDAAAVGGGAPPEALEDDVMNGPVAYGGYGCDGSADVPTPAEVGMPPKQAGEEWIIVLQRGPAFDPDEDYDGDGNTDNDSDDACFPGDKAANADAAGWDAMLLVNRHQASGSGADDSVNCGSGGYPSGLVMVTACTTHAAFHEIFGQTPTFGVPYDDSDVPAAGDHPLPAEGPNIGEIAPNKVSIEGAFDGWGYMSLYSTTPDENGKLPLLDAYAIPEALNPAFSVGFGDLSIHEQAADPTEPLSYSSYYSGGMRVFSFEAGKITPQGAYIDPDGNNFWGVEQFTTPDGERLIAGSDRDFGLFLFRYTGPLAAQKPVCIDSVAMVPFQSTASVPLPCTDANNNPLTRTITAGPSAGTLGGDPNSGAVTYTHTGSTLGQVDAFSHNANDGAATSNTAIARIVTVPREGGRCFNPFQGTAARESITGSTFGDRIRGGGGRDFIDGLSGDDCLDGQGGNDQLEGGTDDDTLRGGPAKDRLFGGSGRDTLRGNKGRDHMRGSSGNDRLFGGNGRDLLDGGSNRDTLRGGKGRDRLRGGPGRDRLFGGAKRDRLEVGDGNRNRASGGRGNDRIFAVNGKRDIIRCGAGRDRVRADRIDRVAGDCERVRELEPRD